MGSISSPPSSHPFLCQGQGEALGPSPLRGGGQCRSCLAAVPASRPRMLPPGFSGRSVLTRLSVSLQEKEKKPLKEGVQDMLVKHHLFSWDIDG